MILTSRANPRLVGISWFPAALLVAILGARSTHVQRSRRECQLLEELRTIHLSSMRYSAALGKSLLDLGRVNPFVLVELEDEGSILAESSIYLHAFRIIGKA